MNNEYTTLDIKETQVTNAMIVQVQLLEELSKELNALNDTLKPILMEEVNEPDKEGMIKSTKVELARKIDSSNDEISRLTYIVRTMNRTCEL